MRHWYSILRYWLASTRRFHAPRKYRVAPEGQTQQLRREILRKLGARRIHTGEDASSRNSTPSRKLTAPLDG